MAGNITSQSKALWAIALGVAGAIGVGTLVKTDSGKPLATALVDKINKTTASEIIVEPKNTDVTKTAEEKTKTLESKKTETKATNKENENKENEIASLDTSNASKIGPESKLEEDVKTTIDMSPPSIDLLRVSPDGGVVIAGRAAPNSNVSVFNGNTKISETKSNSAGDYVVVLDDPLKDGEHELIVKAGKAEADMLNSLTSGIIILPENKADMIVLLSKPGEASKVLKMPSDRFGPKAQKRPQEMANLKDNSAKGSGAASESLKSQVAVNAVDVEEERYYVAGAATPKSTVNIYIDNAFKGKAITGEEGAYLFYGRESISVGKHALRVDMLANDKVTVVSRAEVVLEHEVEANRTMAANEITAKIAGAKDMVIDPNAAIASGSTGKRIADIGNAPANRVDIEKMKSAKLAVKENMAPDVNAAIASGSTGKRIADIGNAPANSVDIEKMKSAKLAVKENMAPDANAAIASGSTGKRIADIGNVANLEADTKVIKSGSSVIIRRGDSLWRVSRRKFGLGSKYTVIYTANRDQVQNPHRIYPGQVLKVPENTD